MSSKERRSSREQKLRVRLNHALFVEIIPVSNVHRCPSMSITIAKKPLKSTNFAQHDIDHPVESEE
jgi:hypothetical protein